MIKKKLMNGKFNKLIYRMTPFAFLKPEGERGISICGHREYVGGKWEKIGRLQFEFLVAEGLREENYLLDIA